MPTSTAVEYSNRADEQRRSATVDDTGRDSDVGSALPVPPARIEGGDGFRATLSVTLSAE